MDPAQDVREVGLWVETVKLCRFNDGHRAREGFRAGIGTRKEPVLAANAHFPFILPISGRFIVFIIDGMPILART